LEKGTPSAHHRQEPYSAEQAIAGMDTAGVARALIHPVQRHPQSWVTDGTLDWLWPAAEGAGVPLGLAAAMFLPTVGRIAERHPGLKLIVDRMGVPRASKGEAADPFQPELLALAKYPNVAVKATGRATPRTNIRSAVCIRICTAVSTRSVPSGCSWARTSPAYLAPGSNA
jgi:hypothetical protein